MKLSRLLPLLVPVLVFSLEEIYFFYPKLIYSAVIFAVLAIFFAISQFSARSDVDKAWWNYLILPAAFTAALMSYTVFLSSRTLIQFLFVFNLVVLYLYLRQVYYYLLNPPAYEVFSIENLSSYINWLAFFMFSSAIFGLQSFLNASVAWLEVINLAATLLLVYQLFWANKIELSNGLPYALLSSFILIELSWSMTFLPFNYNISGLSLAICYYVITGLVKNHLLDKLEKKLVRMYLILGAASLFLILLTAKWM